NGFLLAGALAVLLGAAGTAGAQTPRGDDVQGAAPPGTLGGERPSDGAIKGGSILPGELGGAPSKGRGPMTPDPQARPAQRCAELTGTLRDQCLLDAQGASGGAARSP